MRRRRLPLLSLAALILFSLPAADTTANDIVVEFATSGSTVDNLLSDSSALSDAYSTSSLNIKYYPLASMELNVSGEHTQYSDIIGLTSNYGGIGLTYIPLPASSPLSVYLSGNLTGRVYHRDYGLFDNNGGDIMALIGWRPGSRLSLRSGFSFTSTAYINSAIPYLRELELFAGGHISLPAANSLDLEAGFARSNYEYIDIDPLYTDSMNFFDSLCIQLMPPDSAGNAGDKLRSFYYSVRLSRPLPFKTGFGLLYTNRIFQNDDHNIVYGFTTGYLSPWATIWEGESIALNIKSYMLPNMILTAGMGYWDKTYLRTAEERDIMIRNLDDNEHRRDFQTRWYINIQLPIASRSGWLLEQNLNIEHTSNRSTHSAIYTYDNTSVTAGITLRL